MKKLLIAACVLVFSTLTVFAQRDPPAISFPGLKDKVTVRRDARSIPYIEAKTDADLYFAQGYVTASDRLWQMDLLRRVVRGETAEIFGKAALEQDKRWRKYGFSQIAEDSIKFYTPEMQGVLADYARGVNAFIATLDEASTPIEFKILQYKPREWTPSDTVLIGKLLAEALSSTYQRDLLRESLKGLDAQKLADLTNPVTPYDVVLFGKDATAQNAANLFDDYTKIETFDEKCSVVGSCVSVKTAVENDLAIREQSLRMVGLFAEDLAASNNWVISGKRTADGKPILANDPHLEATAPGIWYLAHLSSPTMRVSGVTFPGSPGIVLGHNENIAWGATNVGPDVQDLYVEKIAGNKVQTADGEQTVVTRVEQIKVRTNPLKTETVPDLLSVENTKHGPVLVEAEGRKYALKWTALDPKNNELEAFYYINRAKDWNSFQSALKLYGGATQNFVYADVKGNIGWYAAGRIPVRKTGEGALPYDGATHDGDWIGYIPFEELPHLYNPPEGFIVTANQRIVGTTYKYQQVSRDVAAPWRARRLYDLLKADTKATMDSVNLAQHDSLNLPLQMFAKDLISTNSISAANLELVKAWDGRMLPDSKVALLVNDIRNCASNKMAAENNPVPASIIRERVLFWAIRDNTTRWLPKPYESYSAMLKACEGEVSKSLAERFGADPAKWVWGAVWTARFSHPLAAAPLIGTQFAIPRTPLDGSGQTPNVGSSVSMRHIASPGNWDATRHVIPLGQSGDPKSPFFKDQFEAWRTGTPAIFPFSKPAVDAATRTITILSPK
ncbi:MAG: penicillin acylase family protein [Pyrinomonadaceae bacterium]